jgi:hypothetical protein
MTELTKKLAELRKGYTFNHSAITNPGKFEGEGIATLYYYDCYLNGGEGVFQVTDEERKEFKLSPTDKWVYLAESNDGFCSLVFFETEEAANKYEYEESGIGIDDIDWLDEDDSDEDEEEYL